jgi:nucleoside-diphosphate-sugar epimerase
MRILIIGGTAFVGRHIAQAAVDAGHEVTLFHRGRTGADLFPQATHLTGNRDEDLSALSSDIAARGGFDATIDVCAYFPRQVRSLAAALGDGCGRYVYISSVSAYSTSVPAGYDESAPLARCADEDATEITNENYGGLEAACERASTELFGPGTTIIRPTFVIGPYDGSYRFPWWVDRLARGGTVLAPGTPDDPIQLIDARDQGSWIVSLLERDIHGTFHSVGQRPPFGFGQMLESIAAEVAPAGTTLAWVPSDFLVAAGIDGAVLPLWSEGDQEAGNMMTADPAAAFAAGLRPRPLRQTVADMRAEDPSPARREGAGLSPEREAELLATWTRGSARPNS